MSFFDFLHGSRPKRRIRGLDGEPGFGEPQRDARGRLPEGFAFGDERSPDISAPEEKTSSPDPILQGTAASDDPLAGGSSDGGFAASPESAPGGSSRDEIDLSVLRDESESSGDESSPASPSAEPDDEGWVRVADDGAPDESHASDVASAESSTEPESLDNNESEDSQPKNPDLSERIATGSVTLISSLFRKAVSAVSHKPGKHAEEEGSAEHKDSPASGESAAASSGEASPEAAGTGADGQSEVLTENPSSDEESPEGKGSSWDAADARAESTGAEASSDEKAPEEPKKKKRVRYKLFDWQLLYLVLALMALGVVAVTSASVGLAASTYDDPLYFGKRDIMYMLMAIAAGAFVLTVPVSTVRRYSWTIIVAAIVMIIVTRLVGHGSHGAVRWIKLGPLTFQPAEFIKIGWLIFVADVISRKLDAKRKKSMGIKVMFPLLIVFGILSFGLVFFQKDFGSMAVLGGVTFAVFLIARLRWIFVIALVVVGGALCTLFVLMEPYRVARLMTFLEPFKDPFGKGFQLTQSLIAFGRGGMMGLGLGNSVQKMNYLPEAHTDFIFAIISEETGLVGGLVVIALFGWYVLRLLHDSRLAFERRMFFEGYAMFGFACLIFSQVFINIAVASGLFPTKGLTLPFISYGGSSVIMMALGCAFMIRCDFERRCSEIPELACLIPDLHGRTEKDREEAAARAAAQAVSAATAAADRSYDALGAASDGGADGPEGAETAAVGEEAGAGGAEQENSGEESPREGEREVF